ncbi:MAG: helix-turn-helix domain-containing protein [Bdellovibrio sp.]|nr:helix-turn-helix domain-containing protein [Bdellovibrio sp.]
MKAFLLTEDQETTTAKSIAKKNAKIVGSSKFLSELHKASSESVWVTDHSSIIELALREPDIFKLRDSLKKKTYMLIRGEANRSWESALDSLFKKSFIFSDQASLSISEILEVLSSKKPDHLAVGGSIDIELGILVITRGDLSTLAVPINTFRTSGDGVSPDFSDFSIVDSGQTLKFGEYEASVDSVLYEFDQEYRKSIKAQRSKTDKSFGACLKRLRIQKGLLQSDFCTIDEKAIGRIERGEVNKPHKGTLNKIAKVLGVASEEISSY